MLVESTVEREELILALREVTDLERIIGRVVYGSANARDLKRPGRRPGENSPTAAAVRASALRCWRRYARGLDDLPELRQELERAIVDEPPFTIREGGMIRPGYSDQVDELKSIQTGGRDLVPRWRPGSGGVQGHPQSEGGLQQGVRLLHRGGQEPDRPGAGALGPQADHRQLRALHQPGVEGPGTHHSLRRGQADGPGVRAVLRTAGQGQRPGGRPSRPPPAAWPNWTCCAPSPPWR